MSKRNELFAESSCLSLQEMQDIAFKRIPAEAEHYASQDHATAVYVQEALFAQSVAQKDDDEDLRDRAALMEASQDDIILFPDELRDLRLRAAYHGAGLATEQDDNIPRPISHRLSDNLSNYPPCMDYEQRCFPWSYKFKPGALRSILLHDFKIAASDYADGDLRRLCDEPEDDEFA